MSRSNFRSGLALIVVIAILGVLVILGTAFVTLARLERRASQQRIHATRALLLARSGLEDALARIGAGQDPDAAGNRYGGEDWDNSGALNGLEVSAEMYLRGVRNTDDCPVRHALRPSFFVKDTSSLGADLQPAPRRIVLEGRERGCSGSLSGIDSDPYALKVTTEGGLYLNGGDPSVPVDLAAPDYNLNLRRMLGILAEALDREDGANNGVPVDQADGENLISLRPGAGWEGWGQVRDVALGGSQDKLAALRPYLTLHAFVDKKVIRPNAVAGMEGTSPQSWADIKLAHETYPGLPGTKEPDFERIPVLPGGKLVGRSPVDLAWARTRRPVLIALLADLRGIYLDEATANPMIYDDKIGTLRSVEIHLDWSKPSDDCRRVADRILAFQGALGTWEQWNAFCDSPLLGGTTPEPTLADANAASAAAAVLNAASSAYNAASSTYEDDPTPATRAALDAASAALDAAMAAYRTASAPYNAASAAYNAARAAAVPDVRRRSLLKANFNPNGDLNKFSPNTSMWKSVDKADLLAYSTEFSLLPQASAREVESVGRILGKDGRLLSSRMLRASIAPAGRLTLSTQKEFVCNDLGDPAVAGDEKSFRQPGQAGVPFISQSQGRGKTWGHALGQAGLGDSGASLQTYPEPCVQAGGSLLSIRAADYDGSVQSATVETPDNECYTVPPGALPPDMKLLARYTADLDLDLADAAPPRPSADERRRNQPDVQQVTYNGGGPANLSELGNGLWDSARPNTLYPDGVYSEKDRAPAYLDRANADGFHGVIGFWVKSNHAPPLLFVRGHPFFKWTRLGHFFFLGDSTGGIVCVFEITDSGYDENKEHHFWRHRMLTPQQWSLVTMYYDFRSPSKDDCGELLLNAGLVDADKGPSDEYNSVTGNDSASAMDITRDLPLADGGIGPHRFHLGKGYPENENGMRNSTGSGADATLDELAIYDFGGAGPGGIPAASDAILASPGVLAANRFKEGRYYKESAYAGFGASPGMNRAAEYFSPLIRLGPCRIKSLAWTQVVPRGLKAPLPAEGQVGVDGDPGDDGRILLDLADAMGSDYLQDVFGRSIDIIFASPASSPVDRTVNVPFRLHAVFQPNLADPDNTPILDALALDDVTVVYEPMGGRRLLAWEQEE